MSNELPEERTKLLVKLWMLLQSSAVDLGISHYDALLKAYANNNFAIEPEQFLADIKAKGLTPTRSNVLKFPFPINTDNLCYSVTGTHTMN